MKFKIAATVMLLTVLFIHPIAFAAQLLFTPRASVTETYTDNLFLTENDEKDDFITRVSAGFLAQLLGKTSGLELSFDPNYEFYQENSEFDEWGLTSNLRAYTSPSKTSNLSLTDNFIRTTDPVSRDLLTAEDGQVEETGDTTERSGRQWYYRNTASLNYSYRFGREDQTYAGFVYGLLRNDDKQNEDNDNYRPFAGLDYWFTQRFGSQLYAEYTRGEYDQRSGFTGRPSSDFDNYLGRMRFNGRMTQHFALYTQYVQICRDFTSGTENNYLVYAPSAGFRYDITQDAYLSLGLGYYWQVIDDEPDQENPFINGTVSKTWNYPRGSINLTGLAGLTQNDFGAQNQGFQQFGTVQASARYDFARRLAADTNAYYRYAYTPGGSTETGNEEDQTDNRAQFNTGIEFLATRWMNIRLGYTFNYYNTDAENEDDYSENRVLLTITLQPDQPWRF